MYAKPLLAASLLLVLPCLALAQGTLPAAVEQACQKEILANCAAKGDKRGSDFRCLADNKAKLGSACAEAVKTVLDRRAELQAACKADADKLCKGTPDKDGQITACLRTKTAELSKTCADALAPRPAAKK